MPRGGARPGNCICRGGGLSFGGTGTQGDPWLIASPKDLIALAEFLNSGDAAANYNNCYGYYFKQTADIDLTGVDNWEPIGYSGGTCFSGNYDGDGHIIANATSSGKVDGDGYATAGIFGWVLRGSVKNLHVKNANFVATGQDNYSYVGGITGICFGASIENCLVTDSILESKHNSFNSNCAGSIAGYSTGGKFNKCAADYNRVTSMAYGGGFVGEVDDTYGAGTSTFTNCYVVRCKVTATTEDFQGSSYAGGFAGQITDPTLFVENCYVYKVKLSTDGTHASPKSTGVFAGNPWNGSMINATNCFYGECFDGEGERTENAGAADQKTAEEFENDIKTAVNLGVHHVSCYGLKIEPGTVFYKKGVQCLPDETDRRMYARAKEILEENGFFRYEISNFAKPGKRSQHNLLYWKCREYVGLGCGAHSYLNGERYSNIKDIKKYISSCGSVHENVCVLSEHDKTEESLIMGMRLEEGADCGLVRRLGTEKVLEKYIENGYIKKENKKIKFTDKGFDVSNYILSELI